MTITRIQVRHDLAAEWTSANTKLLAGEIGVETDTGKFKIGNGTDAWTTLAYSDVNYVHKSLDETIEGTKTFNGTAIINQANINNLTVTNTITGTADKAVKDQKGNVIDTYYQKDLKKGEIDRTTNWNTIVEEGTYKVQIAENDFKDPTQYHYPAYYDKNDDGSDKAVYSFGLLIVSKSNVSSENRTLQMYVPHLNNTIMYRMLNVSGWTNWYSASDRDTKVVHRDGAEKINGVKTFDATPVFSQGIINCQNALEVSKDNKVVLTNDSSNNTVINSHNSEVDVRPTNNDAVKAVFTRTERQVDGELVQGCKLDAWCTKDEYGNRISECYQPRLSLISQYLTEDKPTFDYVQGLKRSTFDKDKFTVVGTPTITDDGIASGLGVGNHYLDTNNPIHIKQNINIPINSNFEIKYRISSDKHTPNESRVFIILKNSSLSNYFEIRCQIEEWTGGQLYFTFRNQESKTAETHIHSESTVPDNKYFDIRMVGDGTQIKCYWTLDGIEQLLGTVDIGTLYDIDTVLLGGMYTHHDLKQFSITVDGVEVFNGNKTGIDQIKKDDYTVVGSPTITNDGIASGFSDSNYLTSNTATTVSTTNTVKFYTKVIWSIAQRSAGTVPFLSLSNSFCLYCIWDGSIGVSLSQGSVPHNIFAISRDTFSVGDIAEFEFIFSNSTITCNLYKNGTLLNTGRINQAYTIPSFNNIWIGKSHNNVYGYSRISTDLNSFKIYVDGNLVYQPTLRIPYYKTKTGAKVTDISHRDRLDDCWDHYGTGNYFNIDEDNKLASLPYDTTYGECKVLETYRGTVNDQPFTYEYNTNLECIETGVCTSGTAVTLPYPYADTNYYVSVPTTAKTTTSFTPSASGDYLTKGRITYDNRKGFGNGGNN